MFKDIKPYLKKNLISVVLYFFASAILWGINIVVPIFSGYYIDSLVSKESNIIVIFVFLIAGINCINVIIQYISAYLTTKLNNTFLYQISNDVYQKIFRTDENEINNIEHQYFIDQVNKDISAIVDFFAGNVCTFFLHFTTILVSIFVVYRADKILSLFILLLLPIYLFTYKKFKNRLYDINLEYKDQLNKFYSAKAEQINRLDFIKRNILYVEMENKLKCAFDKFLHVTMRQVKINYIFSNLNQFVLIISYILVIYIGGMKVVKGDLSIGYFTIINTYFAMIISSTTYFLGFSGIYQQAKVSADRLNVILTNRNECSGTKKINEIKHISVAGLQLCIQKKKIGSKIDVEFEKGKIYVIEGANGCGKTTFINTVIGCYSDTYEGDIYYNKTSLKEIDTESLRRFSISYIEQAPELMNTSLMDYFILGTNMAEERKFFQQYLINVFDLNDLVSEQGKSNILNNYGQNLSGGERQKVALVRGLSKEADVYIFDEPSSALDKKSVKLLFDILLKLKENKIVMVVTHDTRLKELGDVVINLEN